MRHLLCKLDIDLLLLLWTRDSTTVTIAHFLGDHPVPSSALWSGIDEK